MDNNLIDPYAIPRGWTTPESEESLLNAYEGILRSRDAAQAAGYIWAPHLEIAVAAARKRRRGDYSQQPEDLPDDIQRTIDIAGSDLEQLTIMLALAERIANRSFQAKTGVLDFEGNTGHEINFLNPYDTFSNTRRADLLREYEKDPSRFPPKYMRVLKREGAYLIEVRTANRFNPNQEAQSRSDFFMIDLESRWFKSLVSVNSSSREAQAILSSQSKRDLHEAFVGHTASAQQISSDPHDRQLTALSSLNNDYGIMISPQQHFTHFFTAALTLHLLEERQSEQRRG